MCACVLKQVRVYICACSGGCRVSSLCVCDRDTVCACVGALWLKRVCVHVSVLEGLSCILFLCVSVRVTVCVCDCACVCVCFKVFVWVSPRVQSRIISLYDYVMRTVSLSACMICIYALIVYTNTHMLIYSYVRAGVRMCVFVCTCLYHDGRGCVTCQFVSMLQSACSCIQPKICSTFPTRFQSITAFAHHCALRGQNVKDEIEFFFFNSDRTCSNSETSTKCKKEPVHCFVCHIHILCFLLACIYQV